VREAVCIVQKAITLLIDVRNVGIKILLLMK